MCSLTVGAVYEFGGGSLAANDIMYVMPASGTDVLRMDYNNQKFYTLGPYSSTGSYYWYSAVSAPNGAIYGIPYDATTVLKVTNSGITNNFDESFLLSGYYNKY